MSLCWVSATGFPRIFHFKKAHFWASNKGDSGSFSFAEMKSGLGNKEKGKGKGGPYGTHMASVHAAPLNVLAQAGSSQHYIQDAKLFRDRSPATQRAAGNGQRGRLANSRERREARLVGLGRLI